MSARVIPLFPAPPAPRDVTLEQLQRAWLVVEDELAGAWSDSVLIAMMATATPMERGAIIRELEARADRVRRP